MPTRSTLSNANQLDADIIAAVPLVGNRHESSAPPAKSAPGRPWRLSPQPSTGPCSPSEQSNRTSPGKHLMVSGSTATNSSLPSDRLSTWRVAALATSCAESQSQAHMLIGDGVIAR